MSDEHESGDPHSRDSIEAEVGERHIRVADHGSNRQLHAGLEKDIWIVKTGPINGIQVLEEIGDFADRREAYQFVIEWAGGEHRV